MEKGSLGDSGKGKLVFQAQFHQAVMIWGDSLRNLFQRGGLDFDAQAVFSVKNLEIAKNHFILAVNFGMIKGTR